MKSIVNIKVTDRLDRSFLMEGRNGQSIRNWMTEKFIPSSAILLKVNGKIVDDFSYNLNQEDEINIHMVRAYQLPEYSNMLGFWDNSTKNQQSSKKSVYTTQILWFNDSGIAELINAEMDENEFVEWLEKKFVDGILMKDLIEKNEDLCLALSGGRDSLALLYLLQNTRKSLPDFNLVGCTVMPTAASGKDVEIAREAIENLGVTDYTVIGYEALNSIFNLKNGFDAAINTVLQSSGRGKSMASWHSMMRSCIENFAYLRSLKKIVFGYQHEDLVASMIRSQSLGISFGESPYKKSWDEFEIICPLWPITKKELTIYLSIVAPEKHVSQGSPTNFDRGDHNRDLNYFIGDLLSSTIPGYGYQILEGAELISSKLKKHLDHVHCENCNGIYQQFDDMDNSLIDSRYCGTCLYLHEQGEIETLREL